MTYALQQLHPGRNREAMAWLQRNVLAVLYAPCAGSPPVKRAGSVDFCGHRPFSECPETRRHLGVRAPGKGETALSAAEIEHGVAHGLLGPDEDEDDGHGFVRGVA